MSAWVILSCTFRTIINFNPRTILSNHLPQRPPRCRKMSTWKGSYILTSNTIPKANNIKMEETPRSPSRPRRASTKAYCSRRPQSQRRCTEAHRSRGKDVPAEAPSGEDSNEKANQSTRRTKRQIRCASRTVEYAIATVSSRSIESY